MITYSHIIQSIKSLYNDTLKLSDEIKSCLSLSGGTMTGAVHSKDASDNEKWHLVNTADGGRFKAGIESKSNTGAFLDVDTNGNFSLVANNGEQRAALKGVSAGVLSWNENPVLTTANGLALNGSNAMEGPLVVKSRTTLTEPWAIRGDDDNGEVIIGANTTGGGPYLGLYGGNHATDAGCFVLAARTSNETEKGLIGTPSGLLRWQGKDILTSMRTDNNGAAIFSGGKSAYTNDVPGGFIYCFGSNFTESWAVPGATAIYATSSAGSKIMSIQPTGTLTWNGQAMSVTSDERAKQNIENVNDDVLDAWGDVNWSSFRYKEAVQEKGETARKHIGLIAQRVLSVFETYGLDACELGILCHDVWEDEYQNVETVNEDGSVSVEKKLNRPAGDLWTVRYEEALALEAAYQRRRADRIEARLAALESKIS